VIPAARGEVYASLTVCFLFSGVDMMIAASSSAW